MLTMQPTVRRSLAALGGLFVLIAGSARAEGPTQAVDAGGVSFEAPSAWKKITPRSQMRRAQFEIAPAQGDENAAELILFVFPGGAGGVEANVERWRKMFKTGEGAIAKAEVTKAKAKNAEATRVEVSGHYYPSSFPGQPPQADHANYRLLGAIVVTDSAGYFLRMVGPEKTVNTAKADFDKLIGSIKIAEK
jgi:hypothetical protein